MERHKKEKLSCSFWVDLHHFQFAMKEILRKLSGYPDTKIYEENDHYYRMTGIVVFLSRVRGLNTGRA